MENSLEGTAELMTLEYWAYSNWYNIPKVRGD